LAADRWNALMGSARMSVLGSAGFSPSANPDITTFEDGKRHFGCDFWSHHEPIEGDTETPAAQELLTTYVDHLISLKGQ
jgi:hypothetical protein